MTSLSIRNPASIVHVGGNGPVRGEAMADVKEVAGGGVHVLDGAIASIEEAPDADVVVDATGCTVIPGFVDCHTHLPFYGWRADEDGARLSGVRYEAIHGNEGGIYRSQRLLAEAADDEVLAFGRTAAASMLRHGTTSFETKSGYGLSVEAELRQLRLARSLAEDVDQRVVSTCLAAHAVPTGYTQGQWTGEAAEKVLPVAAQDELCAAVDIYVETIAFALEHAARLAEKSKELGLVMRVHADQLENGQTAAFAARWGFRSADHLNHTSLDACDDLAASDTAAVLLPGATFTLRQTKKPPARELVGAGAIVALGSDFNPGTSPLHSMPMVIALACRLYGLHPSEALVAATVNAAYVLGLEGSIGRVATGYRGDLVVLDAPSYDHIPYRPDADLVLATICDGKISYLSETGKARVSGL